MGRNATALPRDKRLEIIKKMLPQGHVYEEIALKCGVHEQTIKNDMKYFRDEGGFDAWLMQEFFDTYDDIKGTNPELAFKGIMRLMMRTMPTRQRVDVNKQIEHRAGPALVEMVRGLLRDDKELPKDVDVDFIIKEPEALEALTEDG